MRLREIRRRLRDDRGDGDVIAMMFVLPLAFGVVLLYSFVGRQSAAVESVTHAADVGARAAAQAGAAGDGEAAASSAAKVTLAGAGTSCRGGPSVTAVATAWEPGGVVTVTVSCSVETDDLASINAPPRTKVAVGRSIIDTYREYAT